MISRISSCTLLPLLSDISSLAPPCSPRPASDYILVDLFDPVWNSRGIRPCHPPLCCGDIEILWKLDNITTQPNLIKGQEPFSSQRCLIRTHHNYPYNFWMKMFPQSQISCRFNRQSHVRNKLCEQRYLWSLISVAAAGQVENDGSWMKSKTAGNRDNL